MNLKRQQVPLHVQVELQVLFPQGPHSQILMTGASDRGSYFISKKITTSEFVYPKISQLQNLSTQKFTTFFYHTQKNPLVLFSQPQKVPLFFSRPPKIPASFIDPQKSLLAKMSDPKKSLGPPVIKICEWGPGPVPSTLSGSWKLEDDFYHKALNGLNQLSWSFLF